MWFKEGYGGAIVPIDRFEATDLLSDVARRRVAANECADWHLSTVFLSWDASLGTGPPMFYETAVEYPDSGWHVLAQYSTRADARAGHRLFFGLLNLGHRPR